MVCLKQNRAPLDISTNRCSLYHRIGKRTVIMLASEKTPSRLSAYEVYHSEVLIHSSGIFCCEQRRGFSSMLHYSRTVRNMGRRQREAVIGGGV